MRFLRSTRSDAPPRRRASCPVVATLAVALLALAPPALARDGGGDQSREGGGGAVPNPTANVGHLGCSMTTGAVEGYESIGGTRMWHPGPWSGGSVDKWAPTSSSYWSAFDALLAQHPSTDTIWWQLCKLAKVQGDHYVLAKQALSNLRARVGSMPVYVSAQPDYLVPICEKTGNGPAQMQDLVDRLVSEGLVLRGPEMPTLSPATQENECSGNAIGEAQMGSALEDAFG